MGKLGIWKSDWFLATVITVVMFLFVQSEWIQGLERKAYDVGIRATGGAPGARIAVIAIDEQSIANIGRWPWPRDVHARMIDALAKAKAKVVAHTVLFSEPQLDPGLAYVNKLIEAYQALPDATKASLGTMQGVLAEAEQNLNTDRRLAASIASAGNVVLPLAFQLGEPRGNPDQALPEFVQKSNLANIEDRIGAANAGSYPSATSGALFPLEMLGKGAAGVGHVNVSQDVDGSIRFEPLVLRYYDSFFPSLSLMVAARSLNLAPKDIKIRLGECVQLGKLEIQTDPALQMYTHFYQDADGRPAFQVDSFYDVISGKIPLERVAVRQELSAPQMITQLGS